MLARGLCDRMCDRQTVAGKSDLLTQRNSIALLVCLIVDVTEGACSDYEVKFAPHKVGAGYFGSLYYQYRSAKTGLTRALAGFTPLPAVLCLALFLFFLSSLPRASLLN